MRRLDPALIVFLLTATACAPETIEAGREDSERSAILEIARTEVGESGLEGDVEFDEIWMRRAQEWAFLRAEIRRPGGGFLYDTDPNYCDADAVIELLLRLSDGRWTIVSGANQGYPYCVSDFRGYDHYTTEFGAPASLFPSTGN